VFRRVRMMEAGWDRDLELESFNEVPQPGPGEVAVTTEAVGVCYRDLIDRAGRFPFLQTPITPGHEAVGRISAVGAGVDLWKIGDRVATMHRDHCGTCAVCEKGDTCLCEGAAHVFGLLADGGYATHVVAPQRAFYAVPDDLDAGLAATLHCTYGTAWRGLFTAGGLRSGEKVVITGANGGVGAAAVDLASRVAGTVVAVIRDGRHEVFVRKQGADHVVVDGTGRFHKTARAVGADVVLECVGAPTFNASLRCTRVGGRVVVVGNVVEEKVALNLGFIVTRGVRVIGPGGATPKDMVAVLAEHSRLPLRAAIDQVMPLEKADTAQRRLQRGGLQGRLVLDMSL
jgi:acryloyl-coenzyme A reductase